MYKFLKKSLIVGIALILIVLAATTAFAKYDPPPVDPEPPTTSVHGGG